MRRRKNIGYYYSSPVTPLWICDVHSWSISLSKIGDWVKDKGKMMDARYRYLHEQHSNIWTHWSSAKTEKTTPYREWGNNSVKVLRVAALTYLPSASHFRREVPIDNLKLRGFHVGKFEMCSRSNRLSNHAIWLFIDCGALGLDCRWRCIRSTRWLDSFNWTLELVVRGNGQIGTMKWLASSTYRLFHRPTILR